MVEDIIRKSLADAGLDHDDKVVDLFTKTVTVRELAPGEGTGERWVEGKLTSGKKAGKTTQTHPRNLLKIELEDMFKIASTIIPLTSTSLYAADSTWQKIAVAFIGLFSALYAGSKRELDTSDAEVLFAIGYPRKFRVPTQEIHTHYQSLFGKELSEDHLQRSLAQLIEYGIISVHPKEVRVQEKLKLKF
jgi:hypothetical protein